MSEKLLSKLNDSLQKGLKELPKKKQEVDKTIESILKITQNYLQAWTKDPFRYALRIYANLLEIQFLMSNNKLKPGLWLEAANKLVKSYLEENTDNFKLYSYYQSVTSTWQRLRVQVAGENANPSANITYQYHLSKHIMNNLHSWVGPRIEENFTVLQSNIDWEYKAEFTNYFTDVWRWNQGIVSVQPNPPEHLPDWVKEFFLRSQKIDAGEYVVSAKDKLNVLLLYCQSLTNPKANPASSEVSNNNNNVVSNVNPAPIKLKPSDLSNDKVTIQDLNDELEELYRDNKIDPSMVDHEPDYICPITQELNLNPISVKITKEGRDFSYTYSRKGFEQWRKTCLAKGETLTEPQTRYILVEGNHKIESNGELAEEIKNYLKEKIKEENLRKLSTLPEVAEFVESSEIVYPEPNVPPFAMMDEKSQLIWLNNQTPEAVKSSDSTSSILSKIGSRSENNNNNNRVGESNEPDLPLSSAPPLQDEEWAEDMFPSVPLEEPSWEEEAEAEVGYEKPGIN
jgi:hypothetical protein